MAGSAEILTAFRELANLKQITREELHELLQDGINAALAKKHGANVQAEVEIDEAKGEIRIVLLKTVVDEVTDESREVTVEEARFMDPEFQVGDVMEIPVDFMEFGRTAVQAAKQRIMQRVREGERTRIRDEFAGRVGDLLSGEVQQIERGKLVVMLNKFREAEAIIPYREQNHREHYHQGEPVRAVLKRVEDTPKGPRLILSRSDALFVQALFKLEVPEVGQGLIQILAAARDPGARAKIAVRSLDPRIDPVGACVGMRGSRVQAVSNEIAGERVDIIPYDDNAAQFVINAMQPAEVTSIVVDEDSHAMDIAVSEEKLSQAIGRGGQNIRLASELTGWKLNIMSEQQAEQKSEAETNALREMFMKSLDVDADVAMILVQEGFSSIEEIAYVPTNELLGIEEFDEEIVKELRNRARDTLLTQAIASEETAGEPAEDLLSLDGMDEGLAQALAARGIRTREELAEQSLEDLEGVEGLDDERAGKLIMAARAHWFADAAEGAGA